MLRTQPRGSSWLRVHREGARELVGKLPEGEMPQLCLPKRVGGGHCELRGSLNKALRKNHSLLLPRGGGRWRPCPLLGERPRGRPSLTTSLQVLQWVERPAPAPRSSHPHLPAAGSPSAGVGVVCSPSPPTACPSPQLP